MEHCRQADTPWQPILTPDRVAASEPVIAEIAADLSAWIAREPELPGDLGRGLAGIALFFHYLDLTHPGNPHAGTAQRLLDQGGQRVGDSGMGFDLYGGISGIGWACQHVFDFPGEDDTLAEVDGVICRLLSREEWQDPFDLISGLVGLGVYGLERWPRGGSREILERVAHHLLSLARDQEPGLAWLTTPQEDFPAGDDRIPQDYFDCGVAHGTPGVIAVLAACARLGVSQDQSAETARGGLRWLLGQESLAPGQLRYPSVVSRSGVPTPSRLAWCYGDLGIAGVLTWVAPVLGDTDLGEHALAVARQAGRAEPEQEGIVDAPLCHGAAGAAHIYNRLYQRTGDLSCRDKALELFERLLTMRTPGNGVGGFRRWHVDTFLDDPGFIEGSAGVGLALLAAASDIAPAWDRALLLSPERVLIDS